MAHGRPPIWGSPKLDLHPMRPQRTTDGRHGWSTQRWTETQQTVWYPTRRSARQSPVLAGQVRSESCGFSTRPKSRTLGPWEPQGSLGPLGHLTEASS
jgi:hypothetical protein